MRLHRDIDSNPANRRGLNNKRNTCQTTGKNKTGGRGDISLRATAVHMTDGGNTGHANRIHLIPHDVGNIGEPVGNGQRKKFYMLYSIFIAITIAYIAKK